MFSKHRFCLFPLVRIFFWYFCLCICLIAFPLHGIGWLDCLTTETVQGAALALEGVYYVQSGDGLAASMLSVGNSVTDDVLQEHFQDTTGFLVDKTRNALDTTTTCETTDSRLGNALDVVTKDFAMAFSTTFAETLSSFSSA